MKRNIVLFIVCILMPVFVCHAQAPTQVRIKADRVNIRAQNRLEAEVLGQLSEGDVLEARSFQLEWVEIVPPDTIDLWVHGDFVKDNVVTAKKLYIRGGPGINYSVVGELSRDDEIMPRSVFGDWIGIQPPPTASLWISREFVDVIQPEKPAPKIPVKPVRAESVETVDVSQRSLPTQALPRSTPSMGEDDNASFEPPKDLELIPLEGQGRHVQREGILRPYGFSFGRPKKFQLIRQRGSASQTICYVHGNIKQLNSFLGKTIMIRGREYWVRGKDFPVVVPEQIIPRAN